MVHSLANLFLWEFLASRGIRKRENLQLLEKYCLRNFAKNGMNYFGGIFSQTRNLKLEIYYGIVTKRKNFRIRKKIGKKTSFLQHRV